MNAYLAPAWLALSVMLLPAAVARAQAETPIPRSVAATPSKHYLIEARKSGDMVVAVHKRVGVNTVTYTRTETNCKTRQMRELGTGEGSAKRIQGPATRWFDLVPGSSRSDLAAFVCK